MIHDIEPKHLYNEWKPNAVPKRSSAVVQFCGRNLLCRIDDNGLKLPSRAMFPDGDERFTYLFELDGREYYLLRDETPREPDGWTYRDINIFRTEQPKEIAFAAVSAWHLCCWYRDTRFCGRLDIVDHGAASGICRFRVFFADSIAYFCRFRKHFQP